MGRRTNLLLLDGEDRIVDCLRRVEGDLTQPTAPAAGDVLPSAGPPAGEEGPEPARKRTGGAAGRGAGRQPRRTTCLLDHFSGCSPPSRGRSPSTLLARWTPPWGGTRRRCWTSCGGAAVERERGPGPADDAGPGGKAAGLLLPPHPAIRPHDREPQLPDVHGAAGRLLPGPRDGGPGEAEGPGFLKIPQPGQGAPGPQDGPAREGAGRHRQPGAGPHPGRPHHGQPLPHEKGRDGPPGRELL